MTDVRLTALNPEDSKVYPVACNTSGELKLEKQGTFDGNLDGDLTVSGTATFTSASFSGQTTHEAGVSVTGGDGTAFDQGIYAPAAESVVIKSGVNTLTISKDAEQTFNFACNKNADDSDNTVGTFFSWQNTGDFNGAVRGVVSALGRQGFSSVLEVSGYYTSCNSGNNVSCDGVISGYRSNVNINANNGSGGAYNFMAIGTAPNFFKGDVIVGSRSKQWMLVEQGGLCHMVEQQVTPTDLVDADEQQENTADLVDAEYPNLRDVFKELDLIEKALSEVMEKLRIAPPAGWEVWDGSDNSR